MEPTIRLDLRAAIPIIALGIVVLAIIIVELCGREDVPQVAEGQATPPPIATQTPGTPGTPGATATAGPQETASPGEPTATIVSSAEGEDRDATRRFDLRALANALAQYHEDNDEYPSSGGNVQTFCAFTDTDAGCALTDVLDPLPEDPLGEPYAENGYWYASDGSTYTIYARRESDRYDACPDHPDHLADIASVMCQQGP